MGNILPSAHEKADGIRRNPFGHRFCFIAANPELHQILNHPHCRQFPAGCIEALIGSGDFFVVLMAEPGEINVRFVPQMSVTYMMQFALAG